MKWIVLYNNRLILDLNLNYNNMIVDNHYKKHIIYQILLNNRSMTNTNLNSY